jgi:Type I phosphodiesterase / nucleotide pyrophosphatase
VVTNHPRDAAEIERRRSDGAGLLAANGASRGNLVSGDAPRCMATMSVVRDRERSQSNEFFSYFADPYGFARTISLFLWDVLLERRAARHQRKRGEQHVARGGIYPFARAAITVAMRDLNVAALLADIVEGVPVAYATFVGYDEVAHHSGITEPDAFAVLRLLDKQLARLERATAQAPRPYHLVVLSDHGQTQGRPFRQRYDLTLEELVRRALRDGSVRAPAAVDEAWGNLGATLAEAREDHTVAGRILNRATRTRIVGGTVALGPNREALQQEETLEAGEGADARDAIVLASGNLGLVYLPERGERMTLEQIDADHPGLVEALAGHPGVGFVMVRSERDGPVAVGGRGLRRLDGDGIEGEDPLAPFGRNAAAHLRRTDGFPHCPDLLVNSMYDPEADEVAPFEEFMGSHGGLGGSQSHPFAVVPSAWSPEPPDIVGVEAMHAALRTWLGETGLEVKPHREPRAPAPG